MEKAWEFCCPCSLPYVVAVVVLTSASVFSSVTFLFAGAVIGSLGIDAGKAAVPFFVGGKGGMPLGSYGFAVVA